MKKFRITFGKGVYTEKVQDYKYRKYAKGQTIEINEETFNHLMSGKDIVGGYSIGHGNSTSYSFNLSHIEQILEIKEVLTSINF